MYFSFGTLGLICTAAVVVWFWHDSLRVREFANAAAMAACERIGLQFLEGTAAFSRLRFARIDGRLRLRRTYVFDYTAQSIERRQGFVILLGMEVEYVGFAPEHTAQPAVNDVAHPSPPPDIAQQVSSDTKGKVLDLNAHRARANRRIQ